MPTAQEGSPQAPPPLEDYGRRPKLARPVKWGLAVLALAVLGLAFVALTHSFWLTRLGAFLLVNEPPVRSDVILVLSGGDERILHGVKLFQDGYAPRIWFSFGRSEAPDVFDMQSIHFTRALEVIRMQGVPETNMVIEQRPLSTYDEAKLAREFVVRERHQSAIVVSSPFHMRRVAMIFRKVFKDSGVRLTFCAVPLEAERLLLDRWWTRERELLWVNNEYCKLILYYFKYVL